MKNIKKIIAAAMAIMMFTMAGCASETGSDNSYTAYDAGNAGGADNGDAYTNAPVMTTAAIVDDAEDLRYTGHNYDSSIEGGIAGVEEEYGFSMWENINSEEYKGVDENGFKSVANAPLSTFSIDVDTASYANARRMIEYGNSVNPDAVRIEEFINYFDYSYSKPSGDDPFSVTTELSDCPWNPDARLLLVGLKAEELDMSERPPMNLVFLIDVSGSMFSDDKLPLVQKSFNMLTESLGEDDRISIVTYAGEDKVVLSGASGADRERITEAVNSLEASGSTYGEAGINRAYELAEKYFIEGGNNRVILATDGDLNVGLSTAEELTRLIENKRESGVFLSVLGFGTGNLKDARMEALADSGNGNYSYIDSELEAKKVLVEEMAGTLYTVAKDVKIQVEFNPANVTAYRLIGYENRALADRDFEDDTKDAGEIGAGHTVTALYEIITPDSEYSPDLKYGQQEDEPVSYNNRMYGEELLTVSLRYKQPDGNTSKELSVPVLKDAYTEKMPDNLTFAAAAAEFGMILRGSEYKGTSSCGQILDMLENYDYRGDDYKTEFVYLVRTVDKRGY